MSTFRLFIELGAEGMRTAGDVSAALRAIADDVDAPRELAPFAETDEAGNLTAGWYQTIHDRDGVDVGRYAVKDGNE